MELDHAAGGTMTEIEVSDYLRSSLAVALSHQRIEAADETIFYVVNLLGYYSEGDVSFSKLEEGVFKHPLAALYMRAVGADSPKEQQNSLRRLGDVALLAASLCATGTVPAKAGFSEYYLSMGAAAYGILAEAAMDSSHARLYAVVFGELATKFSEFVHVLAEVVESAHADAPGDALRLYENWSRTGSTWMAHRLRCLGIEPSAASVSRLQH